MGILLGRSTSGSLCLPWMRTFTHLVLIGGTPPSFTDFPCLRKGLSSNTTTDNNINSSTRTKKKCVHATQNARTPHQASISRRCTPEQLHPPVRNGNFSLAQSWQPPCCLLPHSTWQTLRHSLPCPGLSGFQPRSAAEAAREARRHPITLPATPTSQQMGAA